MSRLEEAAKMAVRLQKLDNLAAFTEEALTSLEQLFQADSSVVLDWTPFVWGNRAISREDMFFHNYREPTVLNYSQYHQEDPIYEWIDSGRCHDDLNVTRLSDLASFREVRKTRFYSEILRPLHCRYVLTMAVHHEGDVLASISAVRNPHQKNFTKSDIEFAKVLVPIFENSYSRLALKNYANRNEDLFEIITRRYNDECFIIFSPDMKSVYRTESMDALGRKLVKYGDSITHIFEQSASISKFITRFSSPSKSDNRRVPRRMSDTLLIKDGSRIRIVLEQYQSGENRRYLLVTLKLLKINAEVPDFRENHDLTMREYQVAELAAEGQNSAEIGKQLAISQWSVKSHLRNIYRKTGVNNRAALAQAMVD